MANGREVTLGEITLPRDEEFELNPFEWAQTSAVAHAQTLKQLADLTARANREKSTIARLDAQLQEFIRTKNEAETAMLQQFMLLLNEKKRKIRDQGRSLADAKVDVETGRLAKQGHRIHHLTFARSFHSTSIESDGQVTQASGIKKIEAQSSWASDRA